MDKEQIEQKISELRQKSQLNRRDRRYLAKLERKLNPQKESVFPKLQNIIAKAGLILVLLLIVGGIIWYVKTRPNLPPIDLEGHIEQNPSSHISDQTMPEEIQKHMMEHADGEDKNGKGIIIQYNCKKYVCEKDLIVKLKSLVKKYPKNVYLTPANYDGKIILTKLGSRQILTSYNEQQIVDFIEGK